jgi:hypothetical protein
MSTVALIAQLVIGLSVLYVWTFRYPNVTREFTQFGLSDRVRTSVGTSKTALATLLLAGLLYPVPVLAPALLMAGFMVCALWFHFKAHNPWMKCVPSATLLALSLVVAGAASGRFS